MGQFIKKVGTTPTRGNGFIIDSFNTNDNKQFNAPSIGAVEERTDNNILFDANFAAVDTGGIDDSICGWTLTKVSGIFAQFAPVQGVFINKQTKITLKSPKYSDFYGLFIYPKYNEGRLQPAFSISVLVEQTSYPAGDPQPDPIVVKFENIVYPYNLAAIPVYEHAHFTLKVSQIMGGNFVFTFDNTSEYSYSIKNIKVETGASCTPYKLFGKDEGTLDTMRKVGKGLLGKFIKVYRYRVSIGSVTTLGTSGAFDIPEESGYVPAMIVGYDCTADICPRMLHIRKTNRQKLDYFVYNLTGINGATPQTKTGAYMDVDILLINSAYDACIDLSVITS